MIVNPDFSIPFPEEGLKLSDFKEKAEAACRTAALLGFDDDYDDKDVAEAEEAILAAIDPDETKQKQALKASEQFKTSTYYAAKGVLNEYAVRVVDNATQIRLLVTNKLLLESDNPDPKIRLKALELLVEGVTVTETARRLGIRTVAVHSTADANLKHVLLADESVCIGPAPSPQSYLNMPAIIAAAEVTDAEAIHPGYGFLSENAGFAERVEKSGFVFIGPTPESIRLMGDKVSAKDAMVDPLFKAIDQLRRLRAMKWMAHVGYTRERVVSPAPLGDAEEQVAKLQAKVDELRRAK